MALTAGDEAMAQARLKVGTPLCARTAVVIGSGVGRLDEVRRSNDADLVDRV